MMWDPPSQPADLLHYVIIVTAIISNKISMTLNVSSATHTIAIDGLESYTLYGVKVEAHFQLVPQASQLVPVQTLQGGSVNLNN